MAPIRKLITLLLALGTVFAFLLLGTVPSVHGQIPIPCIQFTKNGDDVGQPVCENQADDLTVFFAGRARLQFTKDGENVGDVIPSPRPQDGGADEFGAEWANGLLTDFKWRNNGSDTGDPPIPEGANDFKVIAAHIKKVFWTQGGRRIGEVAVPPGANDIRFFFKNF